MGSWPLAAMTVACAWMAAVSLYVELVHYPTFRFISEADWGRFHSMHMAMTGVCVGLPMLVQMAATAGLGFGRPLPAWGMPVCIGLAAFSVGWTMAVSGPIHGRLSTPDPDLIDRLIQLNWPRTLAWTAQALVGAALLAGVGSGRTAVP
jgi:hypothetical protein